MTAHQTTIRTVWLVSVLLIPLLFLLAVPIGAEDNVAISQGFKTSDANIVPGALVSLSPGSQSTVELSNHNRVNQMVGVVGDKSLMELSNKDKEVQVIISGTAPTLVSDINGGISAGDQITASPINGVAMRADDNSLVVGTAQADFNSAPSTQRTVEDKKGQSRNVRVAALPVQINVTYFAASQSGISFLPPPVQSLANAVAGKEVSPMRVIISIVVLVFGFASIVVLLYSSIRSSIISIGRNPLSEGAVRKSLFEVGATALGILLVMLIAIYLVLTT